jgi:hypothetical protein
MNDKRVGYWTCFQLEYRLHGFRTKNETSESINRLRGQGDNGPLAKQLSGEICGALIVREGGVDNDGTLLAFMLDRYS